MQIRTSMKFRQTAVFNQGSSSIKVLSLSHPHSTTTRVYSLLHLSIAGSIDTSTLAISVTPVHHTLLKSMFFSKYRHHRPSHGTLPLVINMNKFEPL